MLERTRAAQLPAHVGRARSPGTPTHPFITTAMLVLARCFHVVVPWSIRALAFSSHHDEHEEAGAFVATSERLWDDIETRWACHAGELIDTVNKSHICLMDKSCQMPSSVVPGGSRVGQVRRAVPLTLILLDKGGVEASRLAVATPSKRGIDARP